MSYDESILKFDGEKYYTSKWEDRGSYDHASKLAVECLNAERQLLHLMRARIVQIEGELLKIRKDIER